MEKQRCQAIESLEILLLHDDHHHHSSAVKCQKCGNAVPIVGRLAKPTKGNRIDFLQRRIKWLENYSRRAGNTNRPSYINEIKAVKTELAELLAEDAERDKLRSLPLYSSRITGWKFVCSKCYDKAYMYALTKTNTANQTVSSAVLMLI
jgi:DNA-directed RNA polymerase subunit M/transcription elongation factor TFIIS